MTVADHVRGQLLAPLDEDCVKLVKSDITPKARKTFINISGLHGVSVWKRPGVNRGGQLAEDATSQREDPCSGSDLKRARVDNARVSNGIGNKEARQQGKPSEHSILQRIFGDSVDSIGSRMRLPDASEKDAIERERELHTFDPAQWLTSSAINTFLAMVEQHYSETVLCVDTYLVAKMAQEGFTYKAVQKWQDLCPKRQFARKRYLFFPYHETVDRGNGTFEGIHWTLIVAAVQESKLAFYDSMGASAARDERKLRAIADFLHARALHLRSETDLARKQWRFEYIGPPDVPAQQDGSSCGKFICAYAGLISAGALRGDSFSQQDLIRFGRDMQSLFAALAARRNTKDEETDG
jgi:hypothetical protein